MLFYWSRRQFDGDIYSLWTYDVNGMATNGNSRVYLLLGVASILIFLLWSRSIWIGNCQDVWMVLWNGTGHAQTGYSITSGSLGVAYCNRGRGV